MSIATCAIIMQEERIAGPWKSGDRLLVAVRGGATSEKLIRYTRRLAASMEASWIVANVDTGRTLSEKQQAQLNRDLALARKLGAEVITTPGTHVGEALLRIAQQHNVTQFILGKPIKHPLALAPHFAGRLARQAQRRDRHPHDSLGRKTDSARNASIRRFRVARIWPRRSRSLPS